MTDTEAKAHKLRLTKSYMPPNPQPDVSFIVAALNVEAYVEAAIASALGQTGVAVEVIVVDDASTDETAQKVEALAARDPRVKIIRRAARGGPSSARNAAMDAAQGTWLAILDADDLLAPERSRRLLDLAAATSADIVADNFERFSDDGQVLSTMLERSAEPYAFFIDVADFLAGNAMFERKARLGYIKAMLRTEFVRGHAIRHDEKIFIGEDFHLLLSCLLAGARFVVTSESFYRYRVREGSISWRFRASDVDRLLEGYAHTGIDGRFQGDPTVKAASQTYVRALARARVIAAVVDDARDGNWKSAVARAASHPGTWPILTRFARAAAAKRLGF